MTDHCARCSGNDVTRRTYIYTYYYNKPEDQPTIGSRRICLLDVNTYTYNINKYGTEYYYVSYMRDVYVVNERKCTRTNA